MSLTSTPQRAVSVAYDSRRDRSRSMLLVVWGLLLSLVLSFWVSVAPARAEATPAQTYPVVLVMATDEATFPSEFIAKNDPVVFAIVTYVNERCPVPILYYDADSGRVRFNTTEYNKLNQQQQEDFMTIALGQISTSSMGAQPQNKFYNFVYNVDSQVARAVDSLADTAAADLGTAASWIRPFSGPVSTALGVISLLIMIFIGFTVLFDMSYIALPMVQVLLGTGEGKVARVISHEAREAVRLEESTGRNAMMVWARTKFVKIFLVGLVLMYFIVGSFWPLVGRFLSVVS